MRFLKLQLVCLGVVAAGMFGCERVQPKTSGQPAKTAAAPKASTSKQAAKPPASGAAGKKAGGCGGGCGHAKGHGHAHAGGHTCGGGTALTSSKVTVRTGKNGEKIAQVGASLSGAQEVSVADLLANPEKFAGKKVALSGSVKAMCHHRRGWFAITSKDGGRFVRIITVPRFLVPRGVIGQSAKAEGTVKVIDVPAAAARHYAKGHKLGKASEIKGNVKRVIVRALGAEFVSQSKGS
jgi:hypothetical protein